MDGQGDYDAREPAWYRTGPPRTENGALVFTRHADVIAAGRAGAPPASWTAPWKPSPPG